MIKGSHLTDEQKARVSAGLRGIKRGPMSDETKAKVSAAKKGKPINRPGPPSEQWRQSQRAAQKRRFGVTGLSRREKAALGFQGWEPKTCIACGTTFTPPKNVPGKKFCTISCGKRYTAQQPKAQAQRAAYETKRHADKLAYNRAYHAANRDRLLAQSAAYAKANRERNNFAKSLYRNRLKYNGPREKVTFVGLTERDGPACAYCGEVPKKPTIDHKIPVSRGGTHTWANTVLACHTCNRRKWARTPEEYQAGA